MTVLRTGSTVAGAQVVHRFDNGYGASVVSGPYSYGGEDGLFELAVLRFESPTSDRYHLTYDTPITSDVIGYLAEGDVDATLQQIEQLPPPSDSDGES
jgi:hypothetical protein